MIFLCLVWTLGKKKCWRTFKHLYQITSVAIGEETGVSGGQTGKIKVFNLLDGSLIKVINYFISWSLFGVLIHLFFGF